MPKLTDDAVQKTEPAEKDITIFDEGHPGLALKITPSGARIFFYTYWSKIEKGKRRRYTIGALGDNITQEGLPATLTLHTARKEYRRLSGIVSGGGDPFLEVRDTARAKETAVLAERARKEAQRSVRTITADLLAHLVEDEKAPRTIREYTRLLDKHLLNVRVGGGKMFGDRSISDIGAADALAIRRQTYTVTLKRAAKKATKGKKGQKGTPAVKATTVTMERTLSKQPVLANRVQQLARSLINYAVGKGRPYGIENPFGGKRWFKEVETRKALTPDEITALHDALAVEDDGERGGSVDAIRFLLYTGMRKNEALSLRWHDVDVDRGLVTLHNTKTGDSIRPLNVEALAILAAIPHRGAYVFPSPDDAHAPRTEIKRTWLRVRARAGFSEPMHSLRNTMASVALMAGSPLAAVGTILGHVRPETTARYGKFGPLAAKAHADTAGAALAPKAPTAGVTNINSRRKAKR